MKLTFSLDIPWVPSQFQTKWHPINKEGPLSILQRGRFFTYVEAVQWGKDHLNGAPYEVKIVEEYEDGDLQHVPV